MNIQNEFVRRTYYSLELKHQIGKDHIENGLSLRECVDKYQLSCHSLVHDWLRRPGYVEGHDRRARSAYLSVNSWEAESLQTADLLIVKEVQKIRKNHRAMGT